MEKTCGSPNKKSGSIEGSLIVRGRARSRKIIGETIKRDLEFNV